LSALANLKRARTRHDVAALLRFRTSRLSYIVYQIPKHERYTTFSIAKKGGGERRIDAPVPRLKLLQRRLADLLTACLEEIEVGEKRKNTFSHAFRKQNSIIDVEHFGLRHRSAIKLVSRKSTVCVLVVSQDGPISFVSSDSPGQVQVRKGVNLTNLDMPFA
jgi:RNA-directed DNA polymerase